MNKDSIWKYNGNLYKISDVANRYTQDRNLQPITVIYIELSTGNILTLPLDKFLENFIEVPLPFKRSFNATESFL